MQVDVPGLQARNGHSATAINLRPGLTEVTLFGGDRGSGHVYADTIVLQFGESTCQVTATAPELYKLKPRHLL